jgi:hypothetical protein
MEEGTPIIWPIFSNAKGDSEAIKLAKTVRLKISPWTYSIACDLTNVMSASDNSSSALISYRKHHSLSRFSDDE